MKKITIFAICAIAFLQTNAQAKYFTQTAKVDFLNKGAVEKISATNNAGTLVIDSKAGSVAFSVLIKSFTFSNATMQQHFNDNYMESNKYDKAIFKGTISNNADVKYTTTGTYTAKVTGKLTMHGQTKDVYTDATITVKSGKVTATTSLVVTLSDYKIKSDGVAKTVTISLNTGNLTVK